MRLSPLRTDRYALYEAAVQGTEYDINFVTKAFRRHVGRPLRLLREDFCGTAGLAAEHVLRHPANEAWGLDLDPTTLAWAKRHRLPHLRGNATRVHLLRADVRRAQEHGVPKVDAILAYNFSYWVFKQRAELLGYLRSARRGLKPGGILVLTTFGGTDTMRTSIEHRRIESKQAVDGLRMPAFRYTWEQRYFNPITHDFRCSIHFRLPGGRELRHAFRYDWRFWMLPELRDLLQEAGYRAAHVYTDGWDPETEESDGVERLRRWFDNEDTWLAQIVAQA